LYHTESEEEATEFIKEFQLVKEGLKLQKAKEEERLKTQEQHPTK
jgi:hypothetical protein